MINIAVAKALSHQGRVRVLEWLRDPVAHFPPQRDGDPAVDGVCAVFIADKLGVSQPTAGEHLRILTDTGLLTSKRVKQWVFYRRDEEAIAEVKAMLAGQW